MTLLFIAVLAAITLGFGIPALKGHKKLTASADLMPLTEQKSRFFSLHTENVRLLPRTGKEPRGNPLKNPKTGADRVRYDNPVEDYWHNTDLYPSARK